MDKKFEFIYNRVTQDFKNERSFYNGAASINQRTWDNMKEDGKFDNLTLKAYDSMMNALFTPYEQMLVKLAIEAKNFNWYDSIEEAFVALKIEHAKMMIENGGYIELAGARYGADDSIKRRSFTQIKVMQDVGKFSNVITFEVSCPQHTIKSGRQNRKEWFDNEFEKVMVK